MMLLSFCQYYTVLTARNLYLNIYYYNTSRFVPTFVFQCQFKFHIVSFLHPQQQWRCWCYVWNCVASIEQFGEKYSLFLNSSQVYIWYVLFSLYLFNNFQFLCERLKRNQIRKYFDFEWHTPQWHYNRAICVCVCVAKGMEYSTEIILRWLWNAKKKSRKKVEISKSLELMDKFTQLAYS